MSLRWSSCKTYNFLLRANIQSIRLEMQALLRLDVSTDFYVDPFGHWHEIKVLWIRRFNLVPCFNNKIVSKAAQNRLETQVKRSETM